MTDERPTCATCRFFDRIRPDDVRGVCRVNAPEMSYVAGQPASRWPVTMREDWCGAHPAFHTETISVNNTMNVKGPEVE